MTDIPLKIEIYTDGSCIGNPGPGGWAAMILIGGKDDKISGNEKHTTNNRMEMMAIIKALEYLHKNIDRKFLSNTKIILYSDSNLLIQSINKNWKRKANTDLWAQLEKLRGWLNIEWKWVKAHHTNKYNNIVDKLALGQAIKAKKAGRITIDPETSSG
ncbi:ribonuclease HI [Candidatus Peregrinibacteria bacterium]|nr:ribonuclease HI [Candidatus Peregrinibacteria bacterium]